MIRRTIYPEGKGIVFAKLPRNASEGTFEHHFFAKLYPKLATKYGGATMHSLHSVVGRFTFWRGKFTPLAEINEVLIVEHERWAIVQGLSAKSVAGLGQKIRMLLRMIDEDLCRRPLQPYRPPPVVRTNGVASKELTVSQYAADRYVVTRSLCSKAEYQIFRSCELLENWLTRQSISPLLKPLDEFVLSQWVKWLELMYSPRSVKRHRAAVLGLLNDAAAAGMREPIQSRRVRCPKVPPPQAKAWPIETVQAIVLACRQLTGKLRNRVPAALYFEALFRSAWCLAIRRGDLWALRMSDIRPDGRVWIVQRKTRTMATGRLGYEEMELLRDIGREQPLEWPWRGQTFYDWSAKVKALAGVADSGHLHRIRKSAATNVASVDRAAATKFLGHTSAAADAHYIDEILLDEKPVEPTRLTLPAPKGGKA